MKYEKELNIFQDKIQPMHDSTTTYYAPYNNLVNNFEDQLNYVQNLIDYFYCCTGIDEYNQHTEDCYCENYYDDKDIDKRYNILSKEFKELERLNDKSSSIRFLYGI